MMHVSSAGTEQQNGGLGVASLSPQYVWEKRCALATDKMVQLRLWCVTPAGLDLRRVFLWCVRSGSKFRVQLCGASGLEASSMNS